MALPADGQNANGLTKVTQIPTGKELMFIDPTTNEGGIITLEDLTKQILNGLTSQTFGLDSGTQTLPAAINYLYGNSAKLNDNSESVNKHQNIGEIHIHTITIGKLVVLQASLKIIGDIPSRTQLVTNIPIKSPLINGISASFVDNSNFDKKILLIDNYGATGGISLTNVENLTKGSYRGAIVMITC